MYVFVISKPSDVEKHPLDQTGRERSPRCIDLSYEPHTLRGALRGEASDGQAAQRAARTALALRAPGRGFILGEGQVKKWGGRHGEEEICRFGGFSSFFHIFGPCDHSDVFK